MKCLVGCWGQEIVEFQNDWSISLIYNEKKIIQTSEIHLLTLMKKRHHNFNRGNKQSFERLWHKRSKVCKAVASLNAFDSRQNWGQSYWHVWPRLWQGSNAWQTHKIFDSSFIWRASKVESKLRSHLPSSLSRIKCIAKSYDIFDTHLTRVKVKIKAIIIFDLDFDQEQI